MKKTALILILIGFFSQILGFTREILLSYHYGITEIADAYLIAITIQTFVISFVITSISLNFITYFKKIENDISYIKARDFTNNTFWVLFVILISIVTIFYFTVNSIIRMIGYGFNEQTYLMAVNFSKITIIAVLFCGLSYLLTAFLHAHNKFNAAAFMGYPMNIVIIVSIFYSVHNDAIDLAYGFLLAYIVQFIFLLLICIKQGLRFSFKVNFNDKYLKSMFKAALPIVIVTVGYEINILIDKAMVTSLMVGGVAMLTYSERLVGALYSIAVVPVMTVIFPKFASLSAKMQTEEIGGIFKKILRVFIVFLIPICSYLFLVSEEVIKIVYGRGEFDFFATHTTSIIFAFSVIGILFFSIRELCLRVYYSMENYRIPVFVSVFSTVVNFILNIIFIKLYGIYGIPISTTVTLIITSTILLKKLEKNIGKLIDRNFLKVIIKVLILTCSTFVFTNYIKVLISNDYNSIFVVFVTAIIFFFMTLITYRIFSIINFKLNLFSIKR